MKIAQNRWSKGQWDVPLPRELDGTNTISFVFFGPTLDMKQPLADLQAQLPNSKKIGCSGAGEIANTELLDETVVVTTVEFERSQLRCESVPIASAADSFSAGASLGRAMQGESLKLVFLLSEGLDINGTELVKGIHSVLGRDMVVAGGLAGDGEKFKRTTSLCNDRIGTGMVVALGVYGDSVKIGVHTGAGWLPFGPLRKITKSSGNILYTLDEKPALKVYREFLGEAAGKLPSSALMFPLLLGPNAAENFRNAVRTILAVDDVHNSMRFAGDMPLGGEFGLCVPMNRH